MAENPITDGTREDHVRAGEQSHKNTAGASAPKGSEKGLQNAGTQGGTHEQHVKAGQQSHKNAAYAPGSHGQRGRFAPCRRPGWHARTARQCRQTKPQDHVNTVNLTC